MFYLLSNRHRRARQPRRVASSKVTSSADLRKRLVEFEALEDRALLASTVATDGQLNMSSPIENAAPISVGRFADGEMVDFAELFSDAKAGGDLSANASQFRALDLSTARTVSFGGDWIAAAEKTNFSFEAFLYNGANLRTSTELSNTSSDNILVNDGESHYANFHGRKVSLQIIRHDEMQTSDSQTDGNGRLVDIGPILKDPVNPSPHEPPGVKQPTDVSAVWIAKTTISTATISLSPMVIAMHSMEGNHGASQAFELALPSQTGDVITPPPVDATSEPALPESAESTKPVHDASQPDGARQVRGNSAIEAGKDVAVWESSVKTATISFNEAPQPEETPSPTASTSSPAAVDSNDETTATAHEVVFSAMASSFDDPEDGRFYAPSDRRKALIPYLVLGAAQLYSLRVSREEEEPTTPVRKPFATRS